MLIYIRYRYKMYYFSSVKAVCAALSEEESSLLLSASCFSGRYIRTDSTPVFIKRLHDKANSVIGTYFISDFREAIQMFDDKSAEGIVIFGYKIRFQTVVYIVQIHRSFDDIDSCSEICRNISSSFSSYSS